MNVIILGPPGSGKGTQAVRVAEGFGIKHLSTGDILREEVREETELGNKAKGYMDKGELVPDDVMLEMIRKEIKKQGEEGWILDGFPRTLDQARGLSEMLEKEEMGIDHVILIQVDSDVIVRRLGNRRVCSRCGAVYNLVSMEPDQTGVCKRCGGKLVKRPDDREETVRRRLEVYDEQTAPVIDYYRKKGGIDVVDGSGEIEEIFSQIEGVLR